jgi:hypothetical protein
LKGATIVARIASFRVAVGEIVCNWLQAGEKRYTGLALVREDAQGRTLSMLRVSDKASAEEYRSLAQAALKLAETAEACATEAEKAAKESTKMSAGQKQRIADGLKNMTPADRMKAAGALVLTFPDFTLEAFGYATATGKSIPEKSPTPPAKNGTVDPVEAALASVGK